MKLIATAPIVLASASPRRKELLGTLGFPFDIVTSDVEETSVTATNPKDYVRAVALLKTNDVAAKCPNHTVIGADTIVVYEDELLHKPVSREEAIAHLQKLSSNRHQVMTAVAIRQSNGELTTFVEETSVVFKQVSQALLEAYVDSGDPFDKAGGYGIQTSGALLVDRIEGDYNNVVGLPLATLTETLLTLHLIKL